MKVLTTEHKEKIRASKIEYYAKLKAEGKKRPYQRHQDNLKTLAEIKASALSIIEKFNDIYFRFGEINKRIIEMELKKDTEI